MLPRPWNDVRREREGYVQIEVAARLTIIFQHCNIKVTNDEGVFHPNLRN